MLLLSAGKLDVEKICASCPLVLSDSEVDRSDVGFLLVQVNISEKYSDKLSSLRKQATDKFTDRQMKDSLPIARK